MTLRLTLKPNEVVIVNGSLIRNSNKRHQLIFENPADIIRGSDMLSKEEANTPLTRLYFAIQSTLVDTAIRETTVPLIQKEIANLITVFGPSVRADLMDAANNVSIGNFYKALTCLRAPIQYEKQLLSMSADRVAEQE